MAGNEAPTATHTHFTRIESPAVVPALTEGGDIIKAKASVYLNTIVPQLYRKYPQATEIALQQAFYNPSLTNKNRLSFSTLMRDFNQPLFVVKKFLNLLKNKSEIHLGDISGKALLDLVSTYGRESKDRSSEQDFIDGHIKWVDGFIGNMIERLPLPLRGLERDALLNLSPRQIDTASFMEQQGISVDIIQAEMYTASDDAVCDRLRKGVGQLNDRTILSAVYAPGWKLGGELPRLSLAHTEDLLNNMELKDFLRRNNRLRSAALVVLPREEMRMGRGEEQTNRHSYEVCLFSDGRKVSTVISIPDYSAVQEQAAA